MATAKAAGSDEVPTRVYKAAAHVLSAPLTHLFNLSIETGRFPKLWKMSHVIPLPKSPQATIDNLRPISLLPVPSKIMEQFVLHSDLWPNFIKHFGTSQFGARPKSSTTCALIKLTDFIASELDKDDVGGVQVLLYDFSKAFDVLSHDTILKRLETLDFPKLFVAWVSDYLTGRFQATRIGNTVSSTLPVTSGVPQGSVLGPAFYCLVAGSLHEVHDSTFMMKYIDDVTFAIPIERSGKSHVSNEHSNMLSWSSENGLKLNLQKSKCLFFKKSSESRPVILENMEMVSEAKILGIILDDQLKWSSHINSVVRLCSRRMYALRILRPLMTDENLKSVYFCLLRSCMEYACQVFVNLPACLERKLAIIQDRAHRLICQKRPSECFCEAFKCPKERREELSVRLFNAAERDTGHILHDVVAKRRSNRTGRLLQPYAKTTRAFSTFVPFTIALINKSYKD